MFDVKLVSSFVAVAECRHFGRAAERVNATQPGVSQHISKLEHQLGYALFRRSKRTVSLTTAGEVFYQRTRSLLAMMNKIENEGRHIAESGFGKIHIGMTSWVMHSEIPRRIAAFKVQNPNVDLDFCVQGGELLRQRFDDHEIDLAITPLPMVAEPYQSRVIARQSLGVALPRTHRLAGGESVTLPDLVNEKFIVVPRECDPHGHDRLLSRMKDLNLALKIGAYEAPSLNALLRVAVGEGIALMPLGYRNHNYDMIEIVPLKDAVLDTADIYAITKQGQALPALAKLLDALS